MDHSSDEIILPELESKTIQADAPAPKHHLKKTLLFAIVSCVVFFALIGSLIYIFVDRLSSSHSSVDSSPIADSSDFKYSNDEFNHAYSAAESFFAAKDYYGAINAFKDVSLPERMTIVQRYRYYYMMAQIYAESALNNESIHDFYVLRVESTHEQLLKGEG